MNPPFSLIRQVESTLNKRFQTLSSASGPFRSQTHDVTWAAGIEMECTYVLNPLDTTDSWDKSFEQFYVPNSDEILKYIIKKGISRDDKYPMIVEAESSGRTCQGINVVKADPVNSMFEIATNKPYQTFRALGRASDILWYALRISDLQEALIRDLNQFYYDEKLYKEKKKSYFSIIPYPFAMTDQMVNADGILLKGRKPTKPKTNYTGSYHVTLTLPFSYTKTTLGAYIETYKRYINQFQWIEPLILAMYSTLDMRGVGNNKNYPRASYRIMLIGWGNPAGSDVRKFDEGLTRKANIELYWRNGLDFLGQQKLEKACGDPKARYPTKYVDPKRNVYDMGADFRTPITRDIPQQYLDRLTNEQRAKLVGELKEEQWRMVGKWLKLPTSVVWGDRDLPPDKLFGVEMRILDYFPARYMPSLLRMMVFLAENSRRTPNKMFVYQDKDWIEAMHQVMKLGWRAELPLGYINKLEKALDLKFSSKPRMAEMFWGVFLKTLYARNHDGFFVKEMLPEKFSGESSEKFNTNKRKQPPLAKKNVNRDSWDFAFLLKLLRSDMLKRKTLEFILKLPDNKNLGLKELEKAARRLPVSWRKQYKDVLYFFSLRDGVTVRINKEGFLVGARTSVIQKNHCSKVIENLIGEIVKLWPELLIYAQGGGKNKD
jgi:hypothetical protein